MGRTRNHKTRSTKNKSYKKAHDTKNRARDIDQIQDDIKKVTNGSLENVVAVAVDPEAMKFEPDEDLPGMGQHYCITCARHFMNETILQQHRNTKDHRRRIKDLEEEQYTQKEAELAAGKSIEILSPAHGKKETMVE